MTRSSPRRATSGTSLVQRTMRLPRLFLSGRRPPEVAVALTPAASNGASSEALAHPCTTSSGSVIRARAWPARSSKTSTIWLESTVTVATLLPPARSSSVTVAPRGRAFFFAFFSAKGASPYAASTRPAATSSQGRSNESLAPWGMLTVDGRASSSASLPSLAPTTVSAASPRGARLGVARNGRAGRSVAPFA